VRLLGHAETSHADKPAVPMKTVRIPTPPSLPKPKTVDEPDERTAPMTELQQKFLERETRTNAAEKRADGGRETGARRKTTGRVDGADGGLHAALESIRKKVKPSSDTE